MSRTFETKSKILDILRQGAKTPAEIGKTLSLSPSTISQHLKELREAGRIEEFTDEHFKNIKYFRRLEHPSIFASNTAKFATGLLALAVLAVLAFSLYTKPVSATSAGAVSILMTDPPHVPTGTQALIVSYSSLKVLISNSTGRFWRQINATGTVNLLSLVNFSRNLSAFNLPANSLVEMMSINISNASITVNGTKYPVVLSNRSVSARVFYSGNSSSYNILFDMFPTVSAVVSGNQTTFVMSPAATAATVDKHAQQLLGQTPGSNYGLAKLSDSDEHALSESRANISITNASIMLIGNQTTISVTVSDNSNHSTGLFSAVVYGNASYELNLNITPLPAGPLNAKMPRRIFTYQNQVMQDMMNFTPGNIGNGEGQDGMPNPNMISMRFNGSTAQALMENLSNDSRRYAIGNILKSMGSGDVNVNFTGDIASGRFGRDISAANYAREKLMEFNSVSFFIRSNGTMSLPRPIGIIMADNVHKDLVMPASMFSEYNLGAGKSATLTYDGSLQFANGRLGVQFRAGERYTIVVVGTNGASASINVTAA